MFTEDPLRRRELQKKRKYSIQTNNSSTSYSCKSRMTFCQVMIFPAALAIALLQHYVETSPHPAPPYPILFSRVTCLCIPGLQNK